MAIKKIIKLKTEVICKSQNITFKLKDDILERECKIKVSSISGSKTLLVVQVEFVSDDISWFNDYSFVPNLEGDNFIKQAYQYLKKLEEFKDAEDC